MRVFDKYTFNIIDKVKFKDTKKYLDDMLANLRLNYNNVSFTFQSFMTQLNKVTEKYPNLDKYRYGYYQYNDSEVLTSLTPKWANGEIYAAKEDWDSIFSIVSKVPRGFNVLPTLVLDKIDWYGEGTREAALKVSEITEDKAMIYLSRLVINSQIIMERQYDYGNKYNIVHVVVEATTEGEPRDTTDIIKKLEPYLGQPDYNVRMCRFDIEENKLFEKRSLECENKLKSMVEEFYPSRKHDYMKNVKFIPNLADKKKIKAAFKGTDFTLGDRKGLLPGMNHVLCIDKHNYQFEIVFDRTQSSPDYFYFYIYVRGCNFSIDSGQKIIFASSEEESVDMLSKIADFCMKIKAEFGDMLEENFGNTPGWYTYN